MAVTSVEELFPGRQGNDDFTRHRTYTRVFEVYTSDPADGPTVAGGSVLLPRLGDSHPHDSQAVVVSVNPSQDSEEPLRWEVSISYDTQPPLPEALQPDGGEQAIGDVPDNPLDRPLIWKFSFEKTTDIVRSGWIVDDETGDITSITPKAVLNSAGMPFDPPPTIEVSRPIVSVTVNVASITVAHLADVQDAVNEFTWNGCGPRTARCVTAEAQSGFENGVYFWTVTYTFSIKWDTWDIRLLDAGFHEIVHNSWLGTDSPEVIVDKTGQNSGPWLLDGNGHRLATGADPVWLRWMPAQQKIRNFGAVFPI